MEANLRSSTLEAELIQMGLDVDLNAVNMMPLLIYLHFLLTLNSQWVYIAGHPWRRLYNYSVEPKHATNIPVSPSEFFFGIIFFCWHI